MSLPDSRAELEEFERALLSLSPNLLGVACRLTRNRAEAEDLVQDTLVKALRARTQYESGTNLKAWLLRILKNTFINRYRRGGLERSLLEGPDAAPLADGWIGTATLRSMRDPESVALQPVVEKEILAALDRLPPEFRLVVILADVEELSYREIADVVGCPIGTVMSRLHRGRSLLKAHLVAHARALGLVTEGEASAPPEPPLEAPVSLVGYRRRSTR